MFRFIFGCIIIIIQVIASIVLLPLGLLLGLFNINLKRNYAYLFCRYTLVMVRWACGIRVKIIGKENIDTSLPILYVANHRSIQDIFVTLPTLPRTTSYMAKESLIKIPVFGWWLKMAGIIAVKREDPRQAMKALMKFIDVVKSGKDAFIFPEGTRNKNESPSDLLEFKAGANKVASKTKCIIQPIAIHHEDVFENHFPKFHKELSTVVFLKPFEYENLDENTQNNLSEYLRDMISEEIKKVML